MTTLQASGIVRYADAHRNIPTAAGEHAVSVLRRGSVNLMLSLGAFAPPRPPDHITVHDHDELYVVVRGRGTLLHGGVRDAFEAGDVMFVAAGVEHRFEDFSTDLAVWVVFYGPPGGELPGCASGT